MRIPRIYLQQALTPEQDFTLDSRNAHYLATVLRFKEGAQLVVFDGSGLEFQGTITALNKKSGMISLGRGTDPGTESSLDTLLGLGLSRGERMDYAVQKSTELGVSVIQPLFSEYCEVKLDARRVAKRLEHWQQISISACEQSGRVVPPTVLPPVPLSQWVEALTCDCKLLLDKEQTGTIAELAKPDAVALLVGPEGGLSENEKALALGKGFLGLNLGPRTLRTETAPVAALSLFQHCWGTP